MTLFRKKPIAETTTGSLPLRQCLSAFDLTLLGVGAIIGAGIFILTGIVAAIHSGPAIVISYILAGFACSFAALSYAELASSIGGCGSVYGYAYAGFGELLAWIVGWDLLLEYAISVSAVSVGWSSYCHDLLLALNIHWPLSLLRGPLEGGILNLLSALIIIGLSLVLMVGAKSSSRLNNTIVVVKLVIITLFISIAVFHVDPSHWSPFMPFGWSGVVQGASLIFFAYIGFDAVATAAEEAISPQRDLPIAIIASLLICTFLYILVSGLLTGIAPYSTLNVASPISHILLKLGYKFTSSLVAVGVIAGLTTVMLVFFYGLSRIFYAMSRDGLLPSFFAYTHPKTQTPVRIILLCGLFMSIISALLPIRDLAELVNIGTLFAFIMVCGGVLVLRHTQPDLIRPFKTPCMPWVPILGMISCAYLMINLPWITIARFMVWMVLGLGIYFLYGRKHSRLNIS